MKNSNNIIRSVIIVLSLTAFFAYSHAQNAAWKAPANFSGMKNPTPANKDNVANGKDLYAKHCKSCHGAAGLGDGPKAATLDVSCGDFSSKAFQAQTDGDIFYKLTEGKGKMPGFKKNLPENNDRWSLVNYMRTLKAK
jgi:mono/diheme cytochrome c family protein